MNDDKIPSIFVSEIAKEHFLGLLQAEESDDMGLRIFVDQPGMPGAEVGISFCPRGDEKLTDLPLDLGVFVLYIDKYSAPYLEGATITYKDDSMGGQLSITAPGLQGEKPTDEAPLVERIEYFINAEVNPNLAAHGGRVELETITDEMFAILRFGGGCQGCNMVDYTLKEGIEKSLTQAFPEIKGVKDVTDHEQGENPYY